MLCRLVMHTGHSWPVSQHRQTLPNPPGHTTSVQPPAWPCMHCRWFSLRAITASEQEAVLDVAALLNSALFSEQQLALYVRLVYASAKDELRVGGGTGLLQPAATADAQLADAACGHSDALCCWCGNGSSLQAPAGTCCGALHAHEGVAKHGWQAVSQCM
jgi:hypothetical protein